MTEGHPALFIVGVSGVGKTTIGTALARRLGYTRLDANDFHSRANKTKMTLGAPLTDADRWPWLASVGFAARTASQANRGVVIACSALTRTYRNELRSHCPQSAFVLLQASDTVLRSRMTARPDHFMPAALLPTRLELLEPLATDEPGFSIHADRTIAEVIDDVLSLLMDTPAAIDALSYA